MSSAYSAGGFNAVTAMAYGGADDDEEQVKSYKIQNERKSFDVANDIYEFESENMPWKTMLLHKLQELFRQCVMG